MSARKIDDIIPPSKRKKPPQSEAAPVSKKYTPKRRGNGKPMLVLGVIVFAIIVVVAALAYLFSGAKVIVYPTSQDVLVDATLTASPSTVPYDVVTLERIARQTVPASGTEEVSTRASGTVRVINETDNPQQWVANTRFEAPGGFIYRISEPVTIPAADAEGPGTIDVVITADQPGAQYNVGLVDFTIPGLAGSPQFEQIRAVAQESIGGGFEGERAVVSEEAAAPIREELRNQITQELRGQIEDQVPQDFILLEGATTITFESLPAAPSEDAAQAELREKGVLEALVLDEQALAGAIAQETIGEYRGSPVSFSGTPALAVSSDTTPTNSAPFDITVSGEAVITWLVNTEELAEAISGRDRAAAQTVLSEIPAVERATLILRPFWKRAFPEDAQDIQISVIASS